MHFKVVAIPLSRPEVVSFLTGDREAERGEPVWIVGQRPTPEAEAAWVDALPEEDALAVADLLALDDPHQHLVRRATSRLVPAHFLRKEHFLTRNLGGWAPIYFAVVGGEQESWEGDDPLLTHAATLADYGEAIEYFGAAPAQVARRLEAETGRDATGVAAAWRTLHGWREEAHAGPDGDADGIAAYVRRLYEHASGNDDHEARVPRLLLFDELLGQMVRLEEARRSADAEQHIERVAHIEALQERLQDELGLSLILKGEYIMGRHRRSTILLAPELRIVAKQPAPEPFHEAELGARTHAGQPENWPVLTGDGALVTARGRLRLIIEEDVVPRLDHVFDHPVTFSALLGLIVEPYVEGPTTQEYVLANPARLTPELYEVYLLHQQVCELLGIENGDWHAANFIVRTADGVRAAGGLPASAEGSDLQRHIVHIDWGAARPLRADEMTPEGARSRLNQVRNIGFSFHDDVLARRVQALHVDIVTDPAALARVRARAQALIDEAGVER